MNRMICYVGITFRRGDCNRSVEIDEVYSDVSYTYNVEDV